MATIDPISGKLHYGLYSNEGQNNQDHLIPDFSYAGYMGGGIPLPAYDDLPIRETLSPSGGDDYSLIQEAINRVSNLPLDEAGIRGVILLEAGTYSVSEQLEISRSGVILRGEGQGNNGTILQATSRADRATLLSIIGTGRGLLPQAASNQHLTRIVNNYLPVGSKAIALESTEGYQVGDKIAIVRTSNDYWLGENGINTARYGWIPSGYKIAMECEILAIEANTIHIDIPTMDTIENQFGGGEVYRTDTAGRLQKVGIENMRLQTLDLDPQDYNRAFHAIKLREVENSWIRDVTLKFFSHGFNFQDGSRNNTAQDIAYLAPDFEVKGGNHYAFNIDGGHGIFFQRCYGEEGRHTFVTGSGVMGPNVFLDCFADNAAADSGPHHRWATGTLYDNTKGDSLKVQNRRTSGSGHGWAGAQQMFWNSAHESYILQAPKGAMNWAVGVIGDFSAGNWQPEEPRGIVEAHNANVQPRSLYLQQLEDRLGTSAVENITMDIQRQGAIWALLGAWKGEGKFTGNLPDSDGDPLCQSGVLSSNGSHCCSTSCDFCGGSGCGGLEGTCCTSTINTLGRSCNFYDAPCVLD